MRRSSATPATTGRRRSTATSRARRWPTSCASGCATRCARTWSPTSRSACCSRAASTPRRWPRWPPSESAAGLDVLDRLRGDARSTSSSSRRQVARRYGTDHHELVVEPDAAELLPTIVGGVRRAVRRLLGGAHVSSSPQLAAEHVKVALSGEGGDELFGGYETYVADLLGDADRRRRAAALAARRGAAERLRAACRSTTSQALHPRRAPAAARAPPRLEGDLLAPTRAPSCCAADRRGTRRPARRLPRRAGPRPRAPTRSRGCRTSTSRSTSSTTCW